MLTPEKVKELVKEIEMLVDDDERAHGKEDDLHQMVLRAIAQEECSHPAKCAEEALKTLALDFARWCA